MSPFDALFVGHLIGDFLLQTNWMATQKSQYWVARLVHVIVYTLSVSTVALAIGVGLSTWGIVIIFGSHFIVDKRTIAPWWVATVMQTTGKESGWLGLVVDQVFHVLILALVLYV